MCDYLDLMGGDVTALFGWRNGIGFGAVLGTTIGFVKATDSSRFATPTLGLWLLIFSLCMLGPALTLFLTAEREPFVMNWCKTMIACGVIYATLGLVIWFREYREYKLARLRLARILEATRPNIHQFPQD